MFKDYWNQITHLIVVFNTSFIYLLHVFYLLTHRQNPVFSNFLMIWTKIHFPAWELNHTFSPNFLDIQFVKPISIPSTLYKSKKSGFLVTYCIIVQAYYMKFLWHIN